MFLKPQFSLCLAFQVTSFSKKKYHQEQWYEKIKWMFHLGSPMTIFLQLKVYLLILRESSFQHTG